MQSINSGAENNLLFVSIGFVLKLYLPVSSPTSPQSRSLPEKNIFSSIQPKELHNYQDDITDMTGCNEVICIENGDYEKEFSKDVELDNKDLDESGNVSCGPSKEREKC